MSDNKLNEVKTMSARAFYLERLSSCLILSGVAPWEFKPASPIPEEVRRDKAKRDAWANSTKHYIYSLCEGLNENLRITKPRSDGEGNPPALMHGLIADYDSPTPEELIRKFATAYNFVPNWIERTLSGNWRFVWLFEEPMKIPSY